MKPWKAGTECPHESYPRFKECLDRSSFHFADDSAKEWDIGYNLINEAVDIAIANKYPFWAIKRMFVEIKPLGGIDLFMGKLLNRLYEL